MHTYVCMYVCMYVCIYIYIIERERERERDMAPPPFGRAPPPQIPALRPAQARRGPDLRVPRHRGGMRSPAGGPPPHPRAVVELSNLPPRSSLADFLLVHVYAPLQQLASKH